MREDYKVVDVNHEYITDIMLNRRKEGCRLVQMHAVAQEGGSLLYYSVATPDNEFINYRMSVENDAVIPSISDIFPSSVLYENEMKELFGVNIDCISLDYKNRLYRINVDTPFKKESDKEAKN